MNYRKNFFLLGGIFRVIYRPKRMIQIFKNFLLDIKYSGAYLGIPLPNENMTAGFTNTTSSEYDVLEELFSNTAITDEDDLVDI